MEIQPLSICEIFESIQGESTRSGELTTFIRLSTCPLRCAWCDSTFSYEQGTFMSIEQILETVLQFGWKHVCVTGGEPLFQKNTPKLLSQLVLHNYAVSLETNGAFCIQDVPDPIKIVMDIKCPSSRMEKNFCSKNLSFIKKTDEIKFVVADKNDFDYALAITKKENLFSKTPHILLSPVYGKLEEKMLVSWMLKTKLPFRLNLQIHKYIWPSETRGV